MDIDKEGPSYKILGFLKIPQGRIALDDDFFLEDVFNMRNELAIETPFPWASEIKSLYVLNLNMENSIYLAQMDLNFFNRTHWTESGYIANYSYVEGEEDYSQIRTLTLKIKTPLRFLKYINTKTVYEIDENIYKARVSINSEDTRADLTGSLEMDEGFIDAQVSADVDSPALYIPRTVLVGKKDFTDKEKRIEFAIHLTQPIKRSAEFIASWQLEDENYAKAFVALETWIAPLRNIEAEVLYVNSIAQNNTGELNIIFRHSPGQEYKLNGDFKNGRINLDIYSPVPTHEHLQFQGDVRETSEKETYEIIGDLVNVKSSDIYKVTNSINLPDGKLGKIEITITPSERNTKTGNVKITIKRIPGAILALRVDNQNFNVTTALNYVNALNWDTKLLVDKRKGPNGDLENYNMTTFMNVQSNGNTTISVEATTPWKEIKNFNLNGNLLLSNVSGHVKFNQKMNEDSSYGSLSWKLDYLRDMFGRIFAGINERSVDARVFFVNPRKAFKNVDVGFDVDIDRERWRFATNASVGVKDAENVDAVVSVRLPPPDNDVHRFLISYHSINGIQNANYAVGYNALKAKTNYASDGSVIVLFFF